MQLMKQMKFGRDCCGKKNEAMKHVQSKLHYRKHPD